jgi:MFS transporter, DHA2 family, multidrug resistance protein
LRASGVRLWEWQHKGGGIAHPGGFVILLLMPVAGLLVSRVDARYLIGFGFLLFAFSLFRMTHLDAQVDFRTVMRWRIYQAAGMAFLFVPVNTLAYVGMPREASNQVSAMTNLMRNMGGSIGISAVTTLLARRQQIHQIKDI